MCVLSSAANLEFGREPPLGLHPTQPQWLRATASMAVPPPSPPPPPPPPPLPLARSFPANTVARRLPLLSVLARPPHLLRPHDGQGQRRRQGPVPAAARR